MTKKQYEHWKDFALRMAKTCFRRHRRPNATWILEQVESWFYWRDYQKDWGNYNSWDQDRKPLCDHISEFFDEYPAARCKACSHDCSSQMDGDCKFCGLECRCGELEDLLYCQFNSQWYGPVRCCIRAGLDMAVAQSAGVLGFTAGDIRAIYPEGVPGWLREQLDAYDETVSVSAVVPGVGFIPEVAKVAAVPFAEWPDSAGVWL